MMAQPEGVPPVEPGRPEEPGKPEGVPPATPGCGIEKAVLPHCREVIPEKPL